MPATQPIAPSTPARTDRLRLWTIGLIAFLTLVDLFAAQAILRSFAAAHGVPAATMGVTVNASTIGMAAARGGSALAEWIEQLPTPALAASFGIGFLILFVFIGTYTCVNFVLVRSPLDLEPMELGLVHLVFLPALLTMPMAGAFVNRLGVRPAFRASLLVTGCGLLLLLAAKLAPVLLGLDLVAVGTSLAQAAATGYVSRTATTDRGAASGLYLASYYLGGLAGSAVLGLVFDQLGWPATVLGTGVGLALAAALARALRPDMPAAALRPLRVRAG